MHDVKEDLNGASIECQAEGKESISAYSYSGGKLRLLYRFSGGPIVSPHQSIRHINSLGHLWRWAAQYCHGSQNEAGKVMGLAPYGDPLKHDGIPYLLFQDGLVNVDFAILNREFGTPNHEGRDITGSSHYADLAAGIQHRTNKFLVGLIKWLRRRYDFERVCYSGGIALNGITNEEIIRQCSVGLTMGASCEDNGTAIGCALAAYYDITGRPREPEDRPTDYYGRMYSRREIECEIDDLRQAGMTVVQYDEGTLTQTAASLLDSGAVVAWFQGKSEFGPRALGNRSILADPRRADMKDILNSNVKFREAYRPYAPAVLEEYADSWFDMGGISSPFMLRVCPVKGSVLPAITHVDGSARVQTVCRKTNFRFYGLIKEFESLTGVPVLLNTSFNVAGEPIVESRATLCEHLWPLQSMSW